MDWLNGLNMAIISTEVEKIYIFKIEVLLKNPENLFTKNANFLCSEC